MVIFHSYVSLPEGNILVNGDFIKGLSKNGEFLLNQTHQTAIIDHGKWRPNRDVLYVYIYILFIYI